MVLPIASGRVSIDMHLLRDSVVAKHTYTLW